LNFVLDEQKKSLTQKRLGPVTRVVIATPQTSGGGMQICGVVHRLLNVKLCQPLVNTISNNPHTHRNWLALKSASAIFSMASKAIHTDSRPKPSRPGQQANELNQRHQDKDFSEPLPSPDKIKESKSGIDAPSNPGKQDQPTGMEPTSWPGSQFILRARTFWQDSLVGPAKRMTARELGVALGIGVWGGLFPVPSTTTAVVAALLALARLAGVNIQPAAAALAIAVNLAITPVQVRQRFIVHMLRCANELIVLHTTNLAVPSD
jgi:hypothetical protein